MSNLGNSLLKRFQQGGTAADIDVAIDAGRQAVAATPPGHPNLAMHLSNLAIPWSLGSNIAGTARTWTTPSTLARYAVAATPPDHPELAMSLSNLGGFLLGFDHTGDRAELDAAIGYWRKASKMPTAAPAIRLASARSWGSVAADAGRKHEAAEGYRVAVDLLPTVAWHGLDRATREEHLAQWAGLAADAAACAIQDGRPDLAVELLEQGRSCCGLRPWICAAT